MLIETARTRLRPWAEPDREALAAIHADPDVMNDLGGPFDRVGSDAKFDRYVQSFDRNGFCRWAVDGRDGRLLGYAGVMASPSGHPLGAHFDIGWRLARNAWGFGYATEAAGAALRDVFARVGPAEVLAYTAPDNFRSQAVMDRLGLRRDRSRDFALRRLGLEDWHGLAWVATPRQWLL